MSVNKINFVYAYLAMRMLLHRSSSLVALPSSCGTAWSRGRLVSPLYCMQKFILPANLVVCVERYSLQLIKKFEDIIHNLREYSHYKAVYRAVFFVETTFFSHLFGSIPFGRCPSNRFTFGQIYPASSHNHFILNYIDRP